jgi:hypothetical protein
MHDSDHDSSWSADTTDLSVNGRNGLEYRT